LPLQQIEESFKRIWKLKEKAIKNMSSKEVSPTNEIPKIDTELNRKLAHASLTLYQGSETTISELRNADYYTLKFPENDPKILSKAQEHTNVLLLITPPKVKPAGNFGFSQNEIDFINTLIQTKNVVLYLFGNPYVLNHLNIENAKAVVIAYQAFTAFKEVAYNHFLGKMTATGKLPVTIK